MAGYHKKAATEITQALADRLLFERVKCVSDSERSCSGGAFSSFLHLWNWAAESKLLGTSFSLSNQDVEFMFIFLKSMQAVHILSCLSFVQNQNAPLFYLSFCLE